MLKQEHAIIAGLATAAAVIAVNQVHLPGIAAIRASSPHNGHIDAARRQATLIGAGIVVLAGLVTQDPTVFVIGGVTVVALDVGVRIANATDHQSGQLAMPAVDATAAPTGG